MKINKRRKLTGKCDMKFVNTDPGINRMLTSCFKPARFYPPEEVGMFGAYICDECFEKKYGEK